MKRILTLCSVLGMSAPVFAKECADLSHWICFGGDTQVGSQRIEYIVNNCETFEIKTYRTDYECTTQGKLEKSESFPIDARWTEKKTVTEFQPDLMSYGTTIARSRYSWNDSKITLVHETETSEDLKQRKLFSDEWFALEKFRATSKAFTREGNEIVERSRNFNKRKSVLTRNEWVSSDETDIGALEPINKN